MREYDDWEVEIHKAAMTYRAASVQDAPEAFEALLRAARQPAAPSVEQDERGAFERYYFGRSYAGTWNAVRDGEYIVERVSDAWKAWQARAASSANVTQGAEAVKPAGKVVHVSDHVWHGYCAILRILGMEEAGDPVEEVERLKSLDAAAPPAQTATTVPSHIINAIIDYGNARADSRDAEANKDLSYAITAIRAALTAAQSASGDKSE